jgi:hypothetical protein
MRIGGVRIINKKWAMMKSELHSDISTIFTIYSLAGWEMAEFPRPLPYHLPVHQARLVSSCLYSLVRKTEIKIFWMARWMATMATRPSTAWEASQSSRNHYVDY